MTASAHGGFPVSASQRCVAIICALYLAFAPASARGESEAADDLPAERGEEAVHSPVSPSADFDEIVITAAPHPRARFEVIHGTTVLSGEELERSLQPTIGETLGELPGVSSTYFGPGASRPVIRGLDGPRIRVLQNGLGALDASVTSPDHALAVDAMQARRIEVVRGAGTLLYGSAAVGGVVNVDDGRIPSRVPEDWLEGHVSALYGSAAEEKAAAAGLTMGFGQVAFRAAGSLRDTNDLSIPGFPVSEQLAALTGAERGPEGSVPNSDIDTRGGTVGGSWIFDEASLGAAYGIFESSYGAPSDPEEAVRIDLEQQRLDLRGELDRDILLFDESSLQLAYADYQHDEIENGSLATHFDNDAWEGRLDFVQKKWKGLHGSMGFQFLDRDFAARGGEAFTPPNETLLWGLFAAEELHIGPFILEAGLRFERQRSQARDLDFDRNFSGVSFFAGAGWLPRQDWLLGVSVARTERLPAAEELLSNGPHLATRGFDVGDPSLDEEIGLTFEATLRRRRGRVTGGINAFYTRFDDYIFLQNIGLVDADGNPDPNGELILREYRQSEANFYGGEVQLVAEAIQHDLFTGIVDLALDYVRAEESDSDEPLPRIPPLRLKAGIEGRSDYLDGRVELWWVREQDRVSQFELPTDGYVMLNASVIVHPFPGERIMLLVQGRNLTDEEARNHVSVLKELVPLPGRDVRLTLRVAF
jgi:iron complex outermembrane receptor protein